MPLHLLPPDHSFIHSLHFPADRLLVSLLLSLVSSVPLLHLKPLVSPSFPSSHFLPLSCLSNPRSYPLSLLLSPYYFLCSPDSVPLGRLRRRPGAPSCPQYPWFPIAPVPFRPSAVPRPHPYLSASPTRPAFSTAPRGPLLGEPSPRVPSPRPPGTRPLRLSSRPGPRPLPHRWWR